MVELLAPAGNLSMVEAAVAGGANAIYVGPRGWSRRRDQYEMSDDDVHAAIGLAHAGGAKLRVAINTNMQSHEIAPMLRKMERFVSWGVDGAIMTDIGAIAEVHRRFPDSPSTPASGPTSSTTRTSGSIARSASRRSWRTRS